MRATGRFDWGGRRSRRSVLRVTGLAGAGVAGAALLGCSDDDDAEPTPAATTPANGGTPVAQENGQAGGRIGLSSSAPAENFNPVTNWAEGNNLSGVQVYDRLFSPRLGDEQYVLEAADSVEFPDETTVVFHLRDGLVFQDRDPVNGREVTADDIVATQEYVRDEPGAVFGGFQRDSMESVEAQDDRTVVFRLRRPNAYLMTASQMGNPGEQCIIPRELIEGDLNQMEPVGSGPYQLADHQFGTRYLYERNPSYWRADEDLPYIDERLRLPIADASALETAFRGEQIHVWIPPADTADRLESDLADELEIEEGLSFQLYTWNMSSNRETWDDPRVREAIYRAFNTEEYIDLVAAGWAVEVPGYVPAGHEMYQLDPAETEEYRRHDPVEARQLLEAAGFDFDRTYEISAIISPLNDLATQIFQRQMQDVGIETTIDSSPTGEWLPNVSNTGNYDFATVTHPPYDSPLEPIRLHHTESRNINAWMNIRDPEIDEMIEASEQELDLEANIEQVKEIQRELARRYAHCSYVYTAIQRELRRAYVRDWEVNLSAQPMYRVEAWLDM